MRIAPKWVWISVIACTLASAWSISLRHQAEASNQAVGLMMEMSDVTAIASSSSLSLEDTLKNLKEHGLVGVSLTEETVEDMLSDGRMTAPIQDWFLSASENRAKVFISLYAPAITSPTNKESSYNLLRLPVGIDPDKANSAVMAGVEVIARHGNYPGLQRPSVEYTLRNSKALGASAYLINGDQAIGNRALLQDTENLIRETGMTYLSPEFVQLGGDSTLRKNLKDRTLRLHSISQLEIEKLSENEIIDRVVKAFRERGVRWILIRPPSQATENSLKATGEILLKIQRAIRSVGGDVKPPRPFVEPNIPAWYAGLIALLATPAMLWASLEVFGRNQFGRTLAAFVALASLMSFHPSFRSLGALAIAIVFPVLGFMIAFQAKAMSALARYAAISAMSFAGGLGVAGMLTGVEYMLRIEAFQGVKLALFLPILIVGYLMLNTDGGWKRHLSSPINWLAAGICLVGLVALALLATRSGNDNPATVSSLELSLRSLMDRVFYVRPRSKEIFFGHPLLMLGALLWVHSRKQRVWASLLVLAGMIGQTSIVNTMCHLHSPVILSILRNLVGLVAGGIIGLVLWALLKRWVPADREPSHENG